VGFILDEIFTVEFLVRGKEYFMEDESDFPALLERRSEIKLIFFFSESKEQN